MTIQNQVVRPVAIFSILALLVGLTFLIPGEAESGGLSNQGHWEWVSTTYAVANDRCPGDSKCEEWCFVGVNGIQPTGQLCCIDQNGNCLD